MPMAASDAAHENVELLVPPEGAVPGERVWFGSLDEKENLLEVASPNQVRRGPSQPLVLSQNFWRSLSLSPFPPNTQKRAIKICEKEKELKEWLIYFQICSVEMFSICLLYFFSGELSIVSVLPLQGIGEAEDSRSTTYKYDDNEFQDSGMSKKHKCHSLQECEIFSCRARNITLIRSVEVWNISLGAFERGVKEFFHFLGNEHIELQRFRRKRYGKLSNLTLRHMSLVLLHLAHTSCEHQLVP